jgi:D-aminopeptidase
MNVRETTRDLGLRFGRLERGIRNDILDVPGFQVGHVSLVRGTGPLVVGRGPVRTGLTVVRPPGEGPWTAAVHVINGYGKSAGLMQVDELGTLEHPIWLTNTLSVGAVLDGYLETVRETGRFQPGSSQNVVVGECNDGYLNDLWGLHVRPEHVRQALATCSGERLEQGAVGAGVGMAGFGYKGGIGSASRRLSTGSRLAALVLLNCGRREDLVWGGRPVGSEAASPSTPDGSIIILLAGDSGLDRWDLRRVARRATHGLARTGATSAPGSGDVVVAVDVGIADPEARPSLEELFLAAVEVTEEAIWNALLTAETTEGRDGHVLYALPHDVVLRATRR